jgi:tRNA G26 N,N-dimethylase Trm1
LLCITCTNSAVLCGSNKMQCFTNCIIFSLPPPLSFFLTSLSLSSSFFYFLDQAMPTRGESCHEFAIRVILKVLNRNRSQM